MRLGFNGKANHIGSRMKITMTVLKDDPIVLELDQVPGEIIKNADGTFDYCGTEHQSLNAAEVRAVADMLFELNSQGAQPR